MKKARELAYFRGFLSLCLLIYGYSVPNLKRYRLRQICVIARKHGLEQLQLSVEKDNVASIKTIEKNGGNYCRSFTFENEEAYVYLIKL